jgi:hypothetical protein
MANSQTEKKMTTKTTSTKRSAKSTKDSKEESAPVDKTVTEQTSTVTTQTAKGSKSSKNAKAVAAVPAAVETQPAVESVPAKSTKASKAASKATAAVSAPVSVPAPASAPAKKGKVAKGKETAASQPADAVQNTTIKAPDNIKVAKKAAKNAAADQQQGEDDQVPGKRYFKCIMIGVDGSAVSNGRYSGKKPKQAASKACTRLYDDMKKSGQAPEQIIFGMHECTRANKKKKKYFYVGKRIALEQPEEVTIKKNDGKEMVIQYHFNNDVRKLTDIDNCQEYGLLANYDAKRGENGEELVVEPVKKARGTKRGKVAGKGKKATGSGNGKKADGKKGAKKTKGSKKDAANNEQPAVEGESASAAKEEVVSAPAPVQTQAKVVKGKKQSAKTEKAEKKGSTKATKTAKVAKSAKPSTKIAKA